MDKVETIIYSYLKNPSEKTIYNIHRYILFLVSTFSTKYKRDKNDN